MIKKFCVVKEIEFHGELDIVSEPLLVHFVVSEKPESEVEETFFLGKVEQPVLEEDWSKRSESESFVLTKE